MLDIIQAKGLMEMNIPEVEWAVPGLFPEGLVLFAGKQKLGKSFLLLNIGLAIAEGREVIPGRPVEQGRVLYLALEDGPGRLQNRLGKMLDRRQAPDKLDIAFRSQKLQEGGLDDIEEYLNTHGDTKLVMIDVLQSVKPKHKQNADSYEESYEYLTPLKRLAEKYHVCIVVVQHMRKSSAKDVIDEIYGSTGNTAVADNIVILAKESNGDKALTVTGRDIKETSYALVFDPNIATWAISLTQRQEDEIDLPGELMLFIRLVDEYPGGITRLETSRKPGKSLDGIDSLARRAVKEGKIRREKGVYYPVRTLVAAVIDDDIDDD